MGITLKKLEEKLKTFEGEYKKTIEIVNSHTILKHQLEGAMESVKLLIQDLNTEDEEEKAPKEDSKKK